MEIAFTAASQTLISAVNRVWQIGADGDKYHVENQHKL